MGPAAARAEGLKEGQDEEKRRMEMEILLGLTTPDWVTATARAPLTTRTDLAQLPRSQCQSNRYR